MRHLEEIIRDWGSFLEDKAVDTAPGQAVDLDAVIMAKQDFIQAVRRHRGTLEDYALATFDRMTETTAAIQDEHTVLVAYNAAQNVYDELFKNTPSKPEQTPTMSVQPRYNPTPKIIKKKYLWEFWYMGKEAVISDGLIGLPMIETLLINKNEEFSALALRFSQINNDDKLKTNAEGQFKSINNLGDIKDIKELEKVMDDLKRQCEKEDDPAKKMSIKEDIEEAYKYIEKNKKLSGKPRNSSDKHRVAVVNAIDLVLDKIKKQNEGLYNHFDKWITRGEPSYYRPDSDIFWEILEKNV